MNFAVSMCEVWNPENFDRLPYNMKDFSPYHGTFPFPLTCTILNLLFHLSPLICPSIVFRDRGIVMSQSLLFSQPITSNLSNRCRSPLPFTWPTAMQIYWNKRTFLQNKNVQPPQGWFGTTTWRSFHCFGHQFGGRDVM